MTTDSAPAHDVEFEWTDEDREKVRRLTAEPKARSALYETASQGLDEATLRLETQRDALAELAAKLTSGEGGTLTADELDLVADAVGAWLLRFAVDDLVEVVARDQSPGPMFPYVAGKVIVGGGIG